MSNIIEYSVQYTPDPAPLTIDVSLSDKKLQVTIASVPPLSFSLSPVGNFLQKIISEILTPIADLVASELKDKPKNQLEGQSIGLLTIGSYTVDSIVITPQQLALGSFSAGGSDMLQVTGSLSLSPQV